MNTYTWSGMCNDYFLDVFQLRLGENSNHQLMVSVSLINSIIIML